MAVIVLGAIGATLLFGMLYKALSAENE